MKLCQKSWAQGYIAQFLLKDYYKLDGEQNTASESNSLMF